MAQYLAELHMDGQQLTLPTPNAASLGEWFGFGFSIRLRDGSSLLRGCQLQTWVQVHSFGGGPTYEWQTGQQEEGNGTTGVGPLFDYTLTNGFVTTEANGQNGHAFFNPGNGVIDLLILVDDAAQTVQFTGPLGTHTRTFAALGWAAGIVSRVSLVGIGAAFNIADTAQALAFTWTYSDFMLSFGGEPIEGAQLGSLQPGSWIISPWAQDGGSVYTPTNGTTESRLIAGESYPAGGAFGAFSDGMHADYNTGLGEVELLLHAFKHPDEGAFFYARIVKQHLNAVEVGYSRDLGHTWATQLVGKVAGRAYISPSLCASPDGSLNLFVNDRSVKFTRWFKSYTYGMDWVDNGAVLPLFSWVNVTHPKFFTLANGFILMTYNQSGQFGCQLFDGTTTGTGFFNHSFGPQAGGFDTYPAIWQNDRGDVYLAWEGAALETEMHSPDFGNAADWDQIYQAALLSQQVVMVKDPASPFLWKLFQGPASGGVSDLLVQGSADAGITALATASVVVAAIPEQYSGLVVGPLGELVAIRQIYNAGTDHWNLQPWISRDFARTWAPA